jgi:hypothetical protein
MKETFLAIGLTIPLVSGYLFLESNAGQRYVLADQEAARAESFYVPSEEKEASVSRSKPSIRQNILSPVKEIREDTPQITVEFPANTPVRLNSPDAPEYENNPPPVTPPTPPVESIADRWKNRPNGPYTFAQAIEDFKNTISGWESSRMHIVDGKLQTTLLKNIVGPAGGLVSWINVEDSDEYELSFDMKFDENFDFSQGGKVGFGFLIGEGNTGGVSGASGNGGSVRLMWYKNNASSPVILRPYVYHKDQPSQYGDDFGKVFPASGNLQKGTWYKVKMYVKSNTDSNTDGHVRITIDGNTLIDQAIRFTTNDAKRLINRITFETFRGGAESSWQSHTDGYIYFDNVSWKAL